MFPIRDDNPQIRTPYVTYALIATNMIAWFLLQGFGNDPQLWASICRFGLIPADLLGEVTNVRNVCPIDYKPNWETIISSMFMHGSWMHLIGNLWFLFIFGNNVEDAMGSWRFLIFYLLCGIAADVPQILTDMGSIIPMVGASGAISGVMGAYIVLYPKVHVHLFFYITTFAVPAVAMLGYWIFVQVLGGLNSLTDQGGGVAFWAHVGGFVAGAILIFFFKDNNLLKEHPYYGWRQKTHKTQLWKSVGKKDRGIR